MFPSLRRSVALAVLALAAAARAQTPIPDPADARSTVRPLIHRSALAGYTAPDAPEVAPWRAVNERVRAVGGWRTYLKQAHAPDPAASAPEVAR